MDFLKRITCALFLLYGLPIVEAQQNQFQIVDASDIYHIIEAEIFFNNTLLTKSKDGLFFINGNYLPGRFTLKSLGYADRSINLESKPGIQAIYLQRRAIAISEVILRSTLVPQNLQEIPAAVSVIGQKEFDRTDKVTILESLGTAPGLFINQGALNTNKITIRGIGARSQYSTNRIQSYFDEIPLATAEGELTLDDFDPESLDHIEIIKGPTSSIFGAGLGGSINLYAQSKISDGNKVKISGQVGSFNTQKYTAETALSLKNASLFASFSNLTSDGFRENGKLSKQSVVINGNIAAHKKSNLTYLANFTRLKAFIPSSINYNDFINSPTTADLSWAQSEGYESYDRGLLGLSYTHFLTEKLQNTTSTFISFRNGYEPRPFDILEEDRISTGVRTKFNWISKILNIKSEISFGGEFYTEWFQTGNFKNLYKNFPGQGSVQGDRISENKQERTFINGFGQINFEINPKFKLETGFNFNTTSYNLTDRFNSGISNQNGNYRFEPIFSPRLGASYELSKGKNFYASISRGFSIPTVAETLTPERTINTDLNPETGTNYEIGFKANWLKNKLYTEINGYTIEIENLLVAQRVAEDQYVGVNAGKTSHQGVEFLANYRFNLSENISVNPFFNGSLNQFEFRNFINNNGDFSGNKLPGVPNYTLNYGLDLKTGFGVHLYLNARKVGLIYLNDSNSGRTDSYQVVNIKTAYKLIVFGGAEAHIYFGINNIFNEKYAASILTNAVGFGGKAPRYYYPGLSRNYYGGLHLQYQF